MRGKVSPVLVRAIPDRITPAYAGKSPTNPRPVFSNRDHPRLCGEKVTVAVPLIPYSGSPPPMRGKETKDKKYWWQMRITPAYAGKSPISSNVHEVSQDHPRLCGEKSFFSSSAFIFLGSPPPMRGKETTPFTVSRMVRITPAYAGKSRQHKG